MPVKLAMVAAVACGVSEMLGHSSVGFTLDVYGHVTARMSKQAANVMDDVFGSVSG